MIFADILYGRNPLVFADALLSKSWTTDKIEWRTHKERDKDQVHFPCAQCEALHGKTFDLTDLPDRPHFGCNCTLNDATTGEELSGLEMFMRVEMNQQRHHSAVSSIYSDRHVAEVVAQDPGGQMIDGVMHATSEEAAAQARALGIPVVIDSVKFNTQHKPTGAQGGQFTTTGGPGGAAATNDNNDGRNHNPATRQPWPARHGLTTPPDQDDDAAPTGNPHALDDDADAPAGNNITATHRRSNPNLTNDDNKKLNDLINAGAYWNPGSRDIDASDLKQQVVETLAKRSGLSERRTDQFVATWAGSSSDTQPDSIALQMAAAEQFNVNPGPFIQAQADLFATNPGMAPIDTIGHTDITPYGDWGARVKEAKKFVAAMYDYTQETLTKLGIKSVTVYRGLGFEDTSPEYSPLTVGMASEAFDRLAANHDTHTAAAASGKPATLDHNPITSWSTDAGQAVRFARSQDNGGGAFVLSADVPAARILSCPATGIGCQDEQEATVIGGHGRKSDTVNVRALQPSAATRAPTAGVDMADWVIQSYPPEEEESIYSGHYGPQSAPNAGDVEQAHNLTDMHVEEVTAQDPGGAIHDGTLHTNNPLAAFQAMHMGVQVQLEQPRQLATLLGLLHDKAQEALAADPTKPLTIDLNLVSVKGTNLFTLENMGLARIEMPQLSTQNPVPGSIADLTPRNDFGSVDLTDKYVQTLVDQGVRVTHETEQPAYLRATQNQLDGIKVGGMMRKIMAGKADELAARPIVISRDNYILDGHHTWAAMVGLDSDDGILGNGTAMNVTRIDMGIMDLLHSAQAYADANGIPSVAVGKEKGPEVPTAAEPAKLLPVAHQAARAPPPKQEEPPKFREITFEERRGNSRGENSADFQMHAADGAAQVANLRAQASPAEALRTSSDAMKHAAYLASREQWGGVSFDAHTGVPVPEGAPLFAVSVKDPGQKSVVVSPDASFEEFSKAWDTALSRFGSQFTMATAHIGVFHDAAKNEIHIDPSVVVGSVREAENIGAATHAVGGAYDFKTGDGVFPPHVNDLLPTEAMRSANEERPLGFGPKNIYLTSKDNAEGGKTEVTPASLLKSAQHIQAGLESIGLAFDAAHINTETGLPISHQLLGYLRKIYDGLTPAEKEKVWYPHERAQIMAALHRMEAAENSGKPMATEAQACATVALMSNNMAWEAGEGTDHHSFPNIEVAMALIRAANNPSREYTFTQQEIADFKTQKSSTGKGLFFKKDKKTGEQPQIPTAGTHRFDELHDEMQAYMAVHEAGHGGMPVGAIRSLKVNRAKGDAIPTTINRWLRGSKVRSFASNIMNPNDPSYVTIDRHAARAMMHHFMSGKQVESFVRSQHGGYALLSAHYFELAHELNMVPNQIQALIWDAVRPRQVSDPDYATWQARLEGPEDNPLWGKAGTKNNKGEAMFPMPSPFAAPVKPMAAQQSRTSILDQMIADRQRLSPGFRPNERQRLAMQHADELQANEDHDTHDIYPAEGHLRGQGLLGREIDTQLAAQGYVDMLMKRYAPNLDRANYPKIKYVPKGSLDPGKPLYQQSTIAETVWPNSFNALPEMHDIRIDVTPMGHNEVTLIHESAHVLSVYEEGQDISGHGAAFRRMYGRMLTDYSLQGMPNLGEFAHNYFPPSTALGKAEAGREVMATISVGGKVIVVCYGE